MQDGGRDDRRRLFELASYARQAAGLTPESSSLRFWQRQLQFGGPRTTDLRGHKGSDLGVEQDWRAMRPPDMVAYREGGFDGQE